MSQQDYDRFIENGEGLVVYKAENMQCRDCIYNTGSGIECEIYSVKPKYVLQCRKECGDYVHIQN